MKALAQLVLWIGWVAGFVLASGFWQTLLCVIPLYSWYLVIEKIMIVNGWL